VVGALPLPFRERRGWSEGTVSLAAGRGYGPHMPLDAQALYVSLGHLIESTPSFDHLPLSLEAQKWLGRASALVNETGDVMDIAELNTAITCLPLLHLPNVHTITAVLHRALAKAELRAPASAQGAFVAVGNRLDAYAAIAKVLSEAKSDVLVVDPYLDAVVITDYLASAPEGVALRLLSDKQNCKATLVPAAKAWASQHGGNRPLEVRLTAPGVLHDRLILVDRAKAWSLTQSIKDFAKRSPATVSRSGDDIAALKLPAYEKMWNSATPLPL
jgi:hypothetical protein